MTISSHLCSPPVSVASSSTILLGVEEEAPYSLYDPPYAPSYYTASEAPSVDGAASLRSIHYDGSLSEAQEICLFLEGGLRGAVAGTGCLVQFCVNGRSTSYFVTCLWHLSAPAYASAPAYDTTP